MKRRDFLKYASCGAMGTTTLLSSLTSLGAMNGLTKISNSNDDYKAIVCILLAGGIDSFNVLVPTGAGGGDNGYADYSALRTTLALQNANILPLNVSQCAGHRDFQCSYSRFGIHNQMPALQGLFNTGKLAFISNIGTLVEPLANAAEYNNSAKKLPVGIYSHSDQIMQWQTSVPQSRNALGFGGRLADILNGNNTENGISMNISLAGKNVFQRGQNITEYSISNNVDPSSVGLSSFPTWWPNQGLLQELRETAIDSMISKTYANLLQKTYTTTAKESMASFDIFKDALQRVHSLSTPFSADSLSRDLQAIAKVISVRQHLGAKRQIFFVTYGGWDMHDDLLSGLNGRLPAVSQAMKSFYDATAELGIADKVTTFTISDFARTLTTNGNGSDHGWGGNNIVMGGAVNGGKLYGAYPKLQTGADNPINISFRGNFIPAVSTDEMYAELALWYGVSPSDLCYVLPNIGNFYSYSPTQKPIGFMNYSSVSNTDHPLNCLSY